jgi:cation diffusion facilitator CzcD-associated flavoprotein CzcO
MSKENTETIYDFIIIGGGISGTSCAHRVIEKIINYFILK